MRKKKSGYVRSANSLSNGIKFYSNKDYSSYAISTLHKGEITVKWVQKNYDVLYYIIIAIILIFCIILKQKQEYLEIFLKRNIKIILKICIISVNLKNLIDLFSIMLNSKLKKYHAAEHMILNAYYDLKEVPTILEVRRYSKFHKRCGTNLAIEILILSLITYIATCIKLNIVNICILICIITLIILLFKLGKMNWFQYLTTQEPTDLELEVAIQGLKEWEKHMKE